MSHFTYLKTQFQNLFYLKKALNKLDIFYEQKIENVGNSVFNNLIIPQSKNPDLKFVWNGHEYELIVDLALWNHASSAQKFVNQIAQKYAEEIIISESHKIGFQPVKYQQNVDGSEIVILERWKN